MTDQEDEYNRALDEGRQRLDEQRWLEASESLQRACTLSPEAPEPNYLLGRALAGLGNWERAASSFARTIETCYTSGRRSGDIAEPSFALT